jgi:hypothetical protein
MEFWVQRLHEALDQVLDEMGDELKERFDEDNEDGTWPATTKTELVQETLERMQFLIDGRLSGFDPQALEPGTSSADVPPGAGNLDFIMEDWIDAVFVRTFLNGLEEMRRRFFTIPAMVLSDRLPPAVRVYIAQATRCYLFGLFQAAAVLARAALEGALADQLAPPNSRRQQDRKLESLIRDAEHLLEAADLVAAGDVREVGNRAAHGQVVQREEAGRCVATVRGLIGRLYPVSA